MKNPLNKRIPREIKSDFGKYAVIFLFLVGMIAAVSGFLVANNSMIVAYDESFEKYNIEDGNFELAFKADSELIKIIEKENLTVYENFYKEEHTKKFDSTIRVFITREEINKACLMEGEFPQNNNEIAIDRMYADNNDIHVGDILTLGDNELHITGFIALSDYSALFSSTSDMMFDAAKFGVGIMTVQGFEKTSDNHLHYSYSWKYDNQPKNDIVAKEHGEALMRTIATNAVGFQNTIINFIPQYSNQAIKFTGNDITGDNKIIAAFLYIVIVILSFIFAITTSNTITKESTVIGTLRASGYSKGELLRHYLLAPLIVMTVGAVVGNILGYTLLKDYFAGMYYNSYSLPTYITYWNASAFIKTTIIPLIIMLFINLVMLVMKLKLSPLKFIRRDFSKNKKKKAVKLNEKSSIIKRFKLRVFFQNMPNYITIILGILFANVILLFGMAFSPMLSKYQTDITENMLSNYQYILKSQHKTDTINAEKYATVSLKTVNDKLKSEDAVIYGISSESIYINIDFSNGVYISDAYANKFKIKIGDEITLKEEYSDIKYSFTVDGIYSYPSTISVFMDNDVFCEAFDFNDSYFNGYFSDNEITDIDDANIAAVITKDDFTKTSRQLIHSLGPVTNLFLVFGIAMYMLIIYLLSKIIIEKNTQSISMVKILGFVNNEINNLYVTTTTTIVIIAFIITIPIVNILMEYIYTAVFSDYPGWMPYYVPFVTFIKMVFIGIIAYFVIAFLQMKKVKGISLDIALKNVE